MVLWSRIIKQSAVRRNLFSYLFGSCFSNRGRCTFSNRMESAGHKEFDFSSLECWFFFQRVGSWKFTSWSVPANMWRKPRHMNALEVVKSYSYVFCILSTWRCLFSYQTTEVLILNAERCGHLQTFISKSVDLHACSKCVFGSWSFCGSLVIYFLIVWYFVWRLRFCVG